MVCELPIDSRTERVLCMGAQSELCTIKYGVSQSSTKKFGDRPPVPPGLRPWKNVSEQISE